MAAAISANQNTYQAAAQTAANSAGVPYNLFYALIDQESGWNPYAYGTAGEIGLTQLLPSTSAALGVTNSWDPQQNLKAGASLLGTLFTKYGSWRQALSAYNSGDPSSAAGNAYADSVLNDYKAKSAADPANARAATDSDILGAVQDWISGGGGNTAAEAGAVGGIASGLTGAGSNVAMYAIVGIVSVAALVLGIWALSRSAIDTGTPIAKAAVT